MDFKYVKYDKSENIATITFNKPEKRNAYQFIGRGEDAQEIYSALDAAADDDEVKVVVLKGEGKGFCAGHDLSKVGFVYGFGTGQPGEKPPGQRVRLKMDRQASWEDWMNRIFLHPKITIAQVHGFAFDAGMIIMVSCDFAVATEDARLGFPGQRIGNSGAGQPIQVMASQIGLRKTNEMLYLGAIIDGKEGERIGLVNYAVTADKLESKVMEMARTAALLPRDGIAIGKARRHLAYESMGLLSAYSQGYVCHTLFTNLHHAPGDFNFFRERRELGTKEAFRARDRRYEVDSKEAEPGS